MVKQHNIINFFEEYYNYQMFKLEETSVKILESECGEDDEAEEESVSLKSAVKKS